MLSRPRRHRRPAILGVVLSLALTVPLASAGAAQAAPAGPTTRSSDRIRPAAAPSSDALATIAGLLAQLLSGPPAPVSSAAPSGPAARVIASTVRVSGVGCGFRVSGSGFSPAPDTIVTNAHVVAGLASPVVQRPDGVTLAAQVQAFDPVRDLAVLAVPGLGEPSLPLAAAISGESGTVFGHPLGQSAVAVTPAIVARRLVTDVGDIYDTGPGVRRILVLSARIQSGDSGAPLVNSSGQVIGVVFATAIHRPTTAFAIASEDLTPVLNRPRTGAVSTGPCLAA